MSEKVANARELYKREATFRAGIEAWVADRRCDLRLVDLLLEYGLAAQADCARWAATEPDRPFATNHGSGEKCGPFPCLYEGDYFWYDCESSGRLIDSHDLPPTHLPRAVNYLTDKLDSAADAILFLLDLWTPGEPNPNRRKGK